MEQQVGHHTWIFPDCEMPPAGESLLKGHESIIVLNTNKERASLELILYFADREPIFGIKETVEAARVRCFRLDNPSDLNGFVIPINTQYSIKIVSNLPIIVQYGRLDTRQSNMAYYASNGFFQ